VQALAHARHVQDRLVVGFDGSAPSRAAVSWAADEAELRGAVLEIVSCFGVPIPADQRLPMASTVPDIEALEEICQRRLDALTPSVRLLHPSVAIEGCATLEEAADALVDRSSAADLLVVGNSGRSAFRSMLLGSTAHAVSRRSECPVAIVRDDRRPTTGLVGVGVDGSPASDAALEWAIDEADRRGARLLVVHAWEPMYDAEPSGTPVAREIAEIDASRVLDRAVERANERGGGDVTSRLTRDLAWHALQAASHEVDLLVVGSRGRGEVRSLLFGSVAHAVTQSVRCPVVVTRRDEA
jgi:nucleotide-binding universal stress UspA family protein